MTLMRNLSYKYKKLGLPFLDYLKFKRFSQGSRGVYKTKLFGNIVTVTSPYWFLHSLDELFIEQVYNFTSDNPAPYILDCGANYGFNSTFATPWLPGGNRLPEKCSPRGALGSPSMRTA